MTQSEVQNLVKDLPTVRDVLTFAHQEMKAHRWGWQEHRWAVEEGQKLLKTSPPKQPLDPPIEPVVRQEESPAEDTEEYINAYLAAEEFAASQEFKPTNYSMTIDRIQQYIDIHCDEKTAWIFRHLSDMQPHHKDDMYKAMQTEKGWVSEHDVRERISDIRKIINKKLSAPFFIPKEKGGKPAVYQIKTINKPSQ